MTRALTVGILIGVAAAMLPDLPTVVSVYRERPDLRWTIWLAGTGAVVAVFAALEIARGRSG